MARYRAEAQIAEIDGDDNRWFCSQFYRREVTDFHTLCRYFCEQGGAADFAKRWDQAVGEKNRWYAGEYYGYQVDDEELLWSYYCKASQLESAELELV